MIKRFTQILVFVLIALFLLSCNNNARPSFMPENEHMVNMFYKLQVAHAMNRYGYIKIAEYKQYNATILSEYGLTANEFDSCLVWLSQNKATYKTIYEQVVNKLQRLQKNVTSEKWQKGSRNKYWSEIIYKIGCDSIFRTQYTQFDSVMIYLQATPTELGTNNSSCYPYVE